MGPWTGPPEPPSSAPRIDPPDRCAQRRRRPRPSPHPLTIQATRTTQATRAELATRAVWSASPYGTRSDEAHDVAGRDDRAAERRSRTGRRGAGRAPSRGVRRGRPAAGAHLLPASRPHAGGHHGDLGRAGPAAAGAARAGPGHARRRHRWRSGGGHRRRGPRPGDAGARHRAGAGPAGRPRGRLRPARRRRRGRRRGAGGRGAAGRGRRRPATGPLRSASEVAGPRGALTGAAQPRPVPDRPVRARRPTAGPGDHRAEGERARAATGVRRRARRADRPARVAGAGRHRDPGGDLGRRPGPARARPDRSGAERDGAGQPARRPARRYLRLLRGAGNRWCRPGQRSSGGRVRDDDDAARGGRYRYRRRRWLVEPAARRPRRAPGLASARRSGPPSLAPRALPGLGPASGAAGEPARRRRRLPAQRTGRHPGPTRRVRRHPAHPRRERERR